MPVFVVGMLLVLVFSLRLRWLPADGYVLPARTRGGFLRHLALPVLALAAAPLATVMRMTRSSYLEEAARDFVRTARAKGLAERVVAWRHVLRNALLPVTSIVGLQVGSMFAAAVLVEYIFSWPGINALLLNSLGTRDYPVIQGVVLLGSTLFVAVNLLTDLCYGLAQPADPAWLSTGRRHGPRGRRQGGAQPRHPRPGRAPRAAWRRRASS